MWQGYFCQIDSYSISDGTSPHYRADAMSTFATDISSPVADTGESDRPELAHVTSATKSFGIRAADTEGKRSSASLLINKMYEWKGYGSGFSVGDRPDQLTLMANDFHSGASIGTLTVGLDSAVGLLVDAVYADEANELRRDGRRLCEMTKFAIERHVNSKHVLAALFHVSFIYAYHLHDRTDLLIEVNPAHVSFYRRLLQFEQLGPEKSNPRVGAPSLLLRLDLEHAAQMIDRYGGQGKNSSEQSLFPYAFSKQEGEGIVARLTNYEKA